MKSNIILVGLLAILYTYLPIVAQVAQDPADMAALFRELNRPEYSTDILPHDFTQFIKLLEYGKNTHKNSAYAERVFRLYIRLIKGSHYINAYTFSDVLNQLPHLLEHYFEVKNKHLLNSTSLLEMDMFDRFKESINNLLYNRFLNDYNSFKQDPDKFLDTLSQHILDIVEDEVSAAQLRNIIVRFLEIALSKLAWSPDDYEQIWPSVTKIPAQLAKLAENNVIENLDDLDDLFWSVTHRFGYFVEIFGTNLPADFYDQIGDDLAHKKLLLVDLEEQQDWLESKNTYLRRILKTNKAKALAHQNGIIART